MRLLYLALQNVALEQSRMPPEFEMQAKSYHSLSQVRNSCKKKGTLKTKYVESLLSPKNLIMERFKKLKWKGENVRVQKIDLFLEEHSRRRHYIFQVIFTSFFYWSCELFTQIYGYLKN